MSGKAVACLGTCGRRAMFWPGEDSTWHCGDAHCQIQTSAVVAPDEPSIRLFVVESTTRPGMLSVRVNPGDATATPFYRAITAAFKLGDVLEVRRVGRKDGQHREPADAVPGESPPAGEKGDEGAGTSIASAAGTGSAGANPVSTIPVPDEPCAICSGIHGNPPCPGTDRAPVPIADELCDIDDLPDCLVGGVHQAHCRHAGKRA